MDKRKVKRIIGWALLALILVGAFAFLIAAMCRLGLDIRTSCAVVLGTLIGSFVIFGVFYVISRLIEWIE